MREMSLSLLVTVQVGKMASYQSAVQKSHSVAQHYNGQGSALHSSLSPHPGQVKRLNGPFLFLEVLYEHDFLAECQVLGSGDSNVVLIYKGLGVLRSVLSLKNAFEF